MFRGTFINVFTCIRHNRSALALYSDLLSVNFRRASSTSESSSGEPASGSNSHICLPRKLLVLHKWGSYPSLAPVLSLHILYQFSLANPAKNKYILVLKFISCMYLFVIKVYICLSEKKKISFETLRTNCKRLPKCVLFSLLTELNNTKEKTIGKIK